MQYFSKVGVRCRFGISPVCILYISTLHPVCQVCLSVLDILDALDINSPFADVTTGG